MTRNLLELSWAQMTSDERWATVGFLIRRTLGTCAMLAGLGFREPVLAVVGAALYLDARLALR